MGLSGLGDLVLTAKGDLSRNRKVGLLLAQGQTLTQAVASLGHVAEGVYSARTVMQRANELGVDMPITAAVVALLDAGDIAGAKAYVTELASLANRYEIHDLTAHMAMNHIRRELIDRNMLEVMEPEWGMAERKVARVHNEQQFRIRSGFWGNKTSKDAIGVGVNYSF
jgi:hypothetical protein